MIYTGKKETYHDIEVEDLVLTISGIVDGEPESPDPACRIRYYFIVTKASFKVELGGNVFDVNCGRDFIEKLNDDYEQQIIDQIKGE